LPVTYSTYAIGAHGEVLSATIQDGAPRTVNYVEDASGQVIRRRETSGTGTASTGTELSNNRWYRFAGVELFESGSATTGADGIASASYTVREGDTLVSIASSLWGDGALWYKLAEANGFTLGSALIAGRTLSVPGGVSSTHHNADTFKPYDTVETLGNTQPGAPNISTPAPPRKKGCGVIGQILLIAIAVAVTLIATPAAGASFGQVLLGAAAGNIASQGVGLVTGIQDKFSFKSLALTVITAGVTAGISQGLSAASRLSETAASAGKVLTGFGKAVQNVGKFLSSGSFGANVIRGAASSAITQGISVATGLQKSFSWTSVAVGGVVGGVSGALQGHFEGTAISRSVEDYAQQTLTGAAAAIAGGATRSLLTGTDFGDNVLAALPDVIGATIGGIIAKGVRGTAKDGVNGKKKASSGEAIFEAITPAQKQKIKDQGGAIIYDAQGNVGIKGLSRKGVVEILGGGGIERTPQHLSGIDTISKYGDNLGYIDTAPDAIMRARGETDGGGVRFEFLGSDVEIKSEYFGMEGVGVTRALQGSSDGYTSAVWLYAGQDTVKFGELGARVSFGKALTSNGYLEGVRSYNAANLASISKGQSISSYTPSVWNNYKQAVWGRQDLASAQWNHGGLGYVSAPVEFLLSSVTGASDLGSSYYRGRQGTIAPFDRQTTDLTLFALGGAETMVSKAGRLGIAAESEVLSPFTTRYLAESGGRLGGTTTRAQNYGISQELRSRGYSFPERPGGGLGSEEFIGGAGAGSKGGTYVDITAIAPNGRTVRIQTIDTLANGLPTPSEAAAAARIRAARPLDKIILVPKGK
jgi:hypothetical protein